MKHILEKKIPKNWLNIIGQILKQKYAIAIAIFIIWVAFIDSNNLFDRIEAIHDLNNLKATKEYYQKKVEEDTRLLNELKKDNKVLERYARERYLMKKEEEEIFLIIEE